MNQETRHYLITAFEILRDHEKQLAVHEAARLELVKVAAAHEPNFHAFLSRQQVEVLQYGAHASRDATIRSLGDIIQKLQQDE